RQRHGTRSRGSPPAGDPADPRCSCSSPVSAPTRRLNPARSLLPGAGRPSGVDAQEEDTTMATLSGMKVAILAAEGFEQAELTEPRKALDGAGAETRVVSPAEGEVQGWQHFDKGDRIKGGVANPDQLRTMPKAVQFVRAFFERGKPVAAICHGPWTLIEAGVVRGRTLTSWPSLKTDLTNAGAMWVDQEVCVDHGLVSSRKPADIPAFNQRMIEQFAGGRQSGKAAVSRAAPGSSPRPH